MSSELQVLHIAEAFDPGGVAWWLIDMNEEARRSGVRFDFMALGSTAGVRADEVRDTGSRITVFDASPDEVIRGTSFHEAIRGRSYDIVHAHIFNLSGWLLRHARRAGVPVRIAHFHTTHDGRDPSLGRLARRTASRWMLTKFPNAFLGCSEAALTAAPPTDDALVRRVIHYGIDPDVYAPTDGDGRLRRELGIPEDVPVIGHVGRFHWQKNHRGLIEIFVRIRSQLPDARLVLIGDGELFSDVRSYVSELGLEQNVVFLGARTDVAGLLPDMDVFAFPSLWEGFGIVLLEARFLGVPVVAADIPSCREAVTGSGGHSLVDPTDQDLFATELVKWLGARTRVPAPEPWQDEFSRRGSAQRLLTAYDDCLKAIGVTV